MAPRVQELLAALDAQKSPFVDLLEGVAGGYANAQQHRIDNAKKLMELQQMREQMDFQAKRRAQLQQQTAIATENKTLQDQRNLTPGTPVTPGQKIKQKTSIDEKGNISDSYETVDETPKTPSYQAKDYLDESTGKNRIGSYNPETGELIKKPTDQLAPKPASELNFGEKQVQYNQKRLTALGDALDPSKQRQGAFGVSKQVYDRAERLQSLASAYPDGNLDSRGMEELAIGLNAMLSGSNTGAQAQVASLVPKSAMGDAQKFKEWFLNAPQGTAQKAFVQRMMGSVDREKQTAADQIKRTQLQRVSRYADLEKSSPDEFYNTLQSSGLDPEEYKAWVKNGRKPIDAVQKPTTFSEPGSFEPDVMAYAQKHKITPEQAAAIKAARTGGKS